jgi:hypothetical protein
VLTDDSKGENEMRFTSTFVAVLTSCLLAALAAAGTAGAAPKGNDNWLSFEATCDGGQQVQFLDPPGPGPSNFVVGGTVGVGMRFLATNLATGEVLERRIYGRGVDEDRLVHCSTVFSDVPTPDGTIDLLFEVWGLVTPQGGDGGP